MGNSYQDVGWTLHKHICMLTERGEFKGHQAARTVLVWFAMNTAVVDDPRRGLYRGKVRRSCISHKTIAKYTGLSSGSVSNAVTWLADQKFITVIYRIEGNHQVTASVEVDTYNERSEDDRLRKLGRDVYHWGSLTE